MYICMCICRQLRRPARATAARHPPPGNSDNKNDIIIMIMNKIMNK